MTLMILSRTKNVTIGYDGVSIKSSEDLPAVPEPAKTTTV